MTKRAILLAVALTAISSISLAQDKAPKADATTAAKPAAEAPQAGVSFVFEQSQDSRTWLTNHGYQFKLDADDPSKARFDLGKRGLLLETLGSAEPILGRDDLEIAQPARLSVTWGVNVYPVGANWDAGINNEAIMVMVLFGHETMPGGFFVPPSPYFIGFFLCESGRRGVAITGRSYALQGRYVCVDSPAAGTQVTSEIDLAAQFRTAFGTATVPPIVGFAIEADTTQVNSNGRASAWIKSIAIRPRR